MRPYLRNRLFLNDFPLSTDAANMPAADMNLAATYTEEDGIIEPCTESKPVPPLEEWAAAVQCTLCQRWRPCSVEEAPKFTSLDSGFYCQIGGFSCAQDQRYETSEIDAIFACDYREV